MIKKYIIHNTKYKSAGGAKSRIIPNQFEIRNLKTCPERKSNGFEISKRGSAWVGILIMLVFVITLGLALMTEAVTTITQSRRAKDTLVAQSLCDAGIEKAMWKLNQTSGGYTGENGQSKISLETGDLEIFIQPIDNENKEVRAIAYIPSYTNQKVRREVRAKLSAEFNESNASFHYGIQAGSLGIDIRNNATVNGNVYVDGNVTCSSNNSSLISGDAYASGAGRIISGCKIGNDAKADYVTNSKVTRNLYYSTSKTGSTYADAYQITQSELPPSQAFPINQTMIDQWKGWAEAGGTTGSVTVNGTQTLGPKKIDGNLVVNGGATLTISGILWVTGNITIYNNSTVKLAPSYGVNSGMIFADHPTDKATYGKITVENGATIQGSGNPSSYIMALTTNTKSTTADPAISVANGSTAIVYYATTGMVEVKNTAHLKAITGGGLYLWNNAIVDYDSGLADANFSAGPGGSWQIKEWQIIY